MRLANFSRGLVALACLTGASLAAHAAPPEQVRVIVAFKPGASMAVKQAVAAARGSVAHEIHGMNAMAVNVPAQAMAGLSRNPNVEYVEEDARRSLLGTGYTASTGTPYSLGQKVPYGIGMVQADQLTAVNASSRKVCIIDSGYDLTHEDLALNQVSGTNVSGTNNWFTDENHHGTHVAGTIAAINNTTGVVGVSANKSLQLHIIKVFNADGWGYTSSLVSAAHLCRDAKANIISMSLGGAVKSKTEERAFNTLLSGGILSIAAAGNDGTTRVSYPAGYGSVMAVAALDDQKKWATFSQYNSTVEIAAPGVNVLSTVPMGTGRESALTVGGAAYAPGGMDGSPVATATAPLFDFGLGDATQPGAQGRVCLIQRGTIDFATKVSNCRASGGVAAVIYNNVAGSFGGTLGTTVTTIPSVTVSDVEGASLKGRIGQSATVAVTASNYAFFDGTSMATPHVSAVAALVWSHKTSCTAAQLRTALTSTAEDLGALGRDTKFGHGLVRAVNARDKLLTGNCGVIN